MKGLLVLCFVQAVVCITLAPPPGSFGGGGSLGPGGSFAFPQNSVPPAPQTQDVMKFAELLFKPESVFKTWCESELARGNATYYSIIAIRPNTKRDLLNVVNQGDILFSNVQMLAGLYEDVHPSAGMREASSACKLQATAITSALMLDHNLFTVVNSFKDQPAGDALDERRYTRLVKGFERSGVNLADPSQRARVQELEVKIQELASKFASNINNATSYVTFPKSDSAMAEGLPEDFIAAHTEGDTVRISTDYPDFRPAMKRAKSSALRRKLYIEFNNRAAPENIAILEDVLAKRHELATVLGYRSWAHYATEMMMIGDEVKASEFMNGISGITAESAERDIALMTALKAETEPNSISPQLQAYDSAFYDSMALERYFNINDTEVRSYFTYRSALEGILMTSSDLFGVAFVKAAAPVWHPDVDVYHVFWQSDQVRSVPIGRFFLDMFPRTSKYKHAAMFPIRSGVEGVQVPEGSLVCNFPATGSMEFSDVKTLFHEFGHLMHHIVGGQEKRYIEFSGVATEWDFVEAPSQMLENWIFDPVTLTRFARSSETGSTIPLDLIDKLHRASLFGVGVSARQQMFYGQLSLQLHTTPGLNSTELLIDLMGRMSPYPYLPGTYFHASFGHLMGYSSNYYTYMWSLAQARHMFSVFQAAPSLLDHDTALRYRESVIRPGGTKPATELVQDFTNKPFNLDALTTYLLQNPLVSALKA